MTSEVKTTLADICSDVNYGYTESASSKQIGPKFLRITDIQRGTIDWDKVPFCIATKQDEKKYSLEIGDIVIARTGNSTGENAQILSTPPSAVFASYLIRYRPHSKIVNPFFVGYQLRSDRFSQYVLSILGGSAQPGANAKQLGAFPIQLIDRKLQDEAVEILRSIDNRIVLLHDINSTLEAIAQAMFKSWFVDFDSVREKREGKKPKGINEETAELFPDSFEQSELGEIPKGWKVSNIGFELTTILGGTPSRERPEFWNYGVVPWINSGKVNEFRITTASELITEKALLKSATKLLPARTTVIAITGATLGQVSIVEIETCTNQSVIGLIQNEKFSTEYIYFWINFNIKKLISTQTGGAQQHINKGNVEDLHFLVPDIRILNKFKSISQPLFLKVAENCFQINYLSNIRDTLLPRLISGKLKLTDVKKEINNQIKVTA